MVNLGEPSQTLSHPVKGLSAAINEPVYLWNVPQPTQSFVVPVPTSLKQLAGIKFTGSIHLKTFVKFK